LSLGLIIPSITISIVPLYPETAVPKTPLKMIERVLSLKEHNELLLQALIVHEGLANGFFT
jgi:hypothetical protein